VRAQPAQDHNANREGEQRTRDGAADPWDGKRKLVAADVNLEAVVRRRVRWHRENGRGVRSRGLEDDEAEIDDARDAELQVQRQAGDDVDTGENQQICRVIGVHPAAASAPRFASRPCGRRTMTSTRMTKATTCL